MTGVAPFFHVLKSFKWVQETYKVAIEIFNMVHLAAPKTDVEQGSSSWGTWLAPEPAALESLPQNVP